MAKQQFNIEFNGTMRLELDDAVIGAMPEYAPFEIAEHVIYNMVLNKLTLSQIDGFADQPDSNARLYGEDWNIEAETED